MDKKRLSAERASRLMAPNQKGFVAIFTTMIIMIILTLITVSFSNLVRREQKRTLDRQLNTQAFYAAESGINDAVAAINAKTLITDKTDCNTAPSLSGVVDASLGVTYSCLLVKMQLPDIIKQNVPEEGKDAPFIIPVTPVSSTVKSFSIHWDSAAAGAGLPGSGTTDLPTQVAWGNNVGMLRIDLMPTSSGLDRAPLVNGAIQFFLYPSTVGTLGPFAPDKGNIFLGQCSAAAAPYRCNANISIPVPSASYVMRVTSVYHPTNLLMDNFKDAGGTALLLKDGQALIDSTGKANDIFRRIQVRVPVNEASKYSFPDFSLMAGNGICKRIEAYPSMPDSPGPDPACGIN